MELGPQNHNGDGLSGPNSIIVVYMDPLGKLRRSYDRRLQTPRSALNPEPQNASPQRFSSEAQGDGDQGLHEDSRCQDSRVYKP